MSTATTPIHQTQGFVLPVDDAPEPVVEPTLAEVLPEPEPSDIPTLDDVRNLFRAMGTCCRTMVQGRDDVIALVLTALFADGHVLLEDHPGSGKTTLAKALGNTIIHNRPSDLFAAFRRIQFTPDLLPSDVTGVTMFDTETNAFTFRNGPIFANVVLADEINRTSPKVQAALLEAMAEKQVTVDNQTHRLEDVFFVLATQNPLDLAGTYPLPRAQLDRFLFKIKMTHLARDGELAVLSKWKAARAKPCEFGVTPADLLVARRVIEGSVRVTPAIHECLVDVAQATRKDKRVALGVSTRSLVLAISALQVWAMVHGRDYVSPKDIKALSVPLFSHRLELAPGAHDADKIIVECVAPVVERLTRKSLAA
jgi:MoxR-like ATPase